MKHVLVVVAVACLVFCAAPGAIAGAQDPVGLAGMPSSTSVGPAVGAPVTPTVHPILSDVNVRRAIAYCTDKDALVASVYPALTAQQRQELIMDTFLAKSSWAYSTPVVTYPYSPATGQALLDQAGWILAAGDEYRTKGGEELTLTITSTDAAFRKTYLAVFEAQMKACGIRMLRNHQPGSWWLGDYTGLQVRDFELGNYAWVLDPDEPGGLTLYGCDFIPSPADGWTGQNYMGWCNLAASDAIEVASDTSLSQDARKPYYAIVVDAFARDVPSLPLFVREDTTTYEHIDLNLETYRQEMEAVPQAAATLATTDFHGNQGEIAVPAGAVTQALALGYHPELVPAHEPPAGQAAAATFRMDVTIGNVPQGSYAFSKPIVVTVTYSGANMVNVADEAALNLLYWDGDSWEPAILTCPEAVRQYQHNLDLNRVDATVCHLSEFSLMGDFTYKTHLTIGLRTR